jgi:uncharacterized protein (TIGR03437 family)
MMRILGIILAVPFFCCGQAIITTVAGGGTGDYTKGGPATSLSLGSVYGVTLDAGGNIYIVSSSRILKVDTSGNLSTVAGGGKGSTYPGPATSVNISPGGVAVDSAGNLFISDTLSTRVLEVNPAGIISVFAGTGNMAYSGDGGPAIKATFEVPRGLAFDRAGNLYIADENNGVIRKVNTAGIISTVAGNRNMGFSGDGGPATKAEIDNPTGVATDAAGNFYTVGQIGGRVRKVDTKGIITTAAGSANDGYSGDGGPATSAELNSAAAVTLDGAGNMYIADKDNARVRKVDTNGIITTVAGTGQRGDTGDGGPATSAELFSPEGVGVDSFGNLYIAENTNGLIRKITFPGVPTISSVVNGASFQPGIVAGSWATIQGSSLSAMTDTWGSLIVNGKLPTTVDGVSVTVGGQPAYVDYISPGQINFIVPNVASGPQPVVVTNSFGTSASFTATVNSFGPAFFPWQNSDQVIATRQDFSYVAKNGTIRGATSVPAKPGDVIILWGTGFGPTTPAVAEGQETPSDTIYSTSLLPTITINNISATVYGAALSPGSAGLYQVAIQVPNSLGNGDWPVIATIGGVSSPAGAILSVQE